MRLQLSLMIIAASVCSSALGQTQRSGGGGEAQKFMLQYQQVSAEKTALQTQLAQMKKDLDAAHAERDAAKKERDALKARAGGSVAALSQLTQSKETAEKNLEQYKQRMTELVARFRETANNLKEVEADRTQLRKTLDERNTAYDRCAASNLGLYEVNKEILDRYERIGPFTKVTAADPVTRITRTRIENLVDEYRQRALELRLKDKPSP